MQMSQSKWNLVVFVTNFVVFLLQFGLCSMLILALLEVRQQQLVTIIGPVAKVTKSDWSWVQTNMSLFDRKDTTSFQDWSPVSCRVKVLPQVKSVLWVFLHSWFTTQMFSAHCSGSHGWDGNRSCQRRIYTEAFLSIWWNSLRDQILLFTWTLVGLMCSFPPCGALWSRAADQHLKQRCWLLHCWIWRWLRPQGQARDLLVLCWDYWLAHVTWPTWPGQLLWIQMRLDLIHIVVFVVITKRRCIRTR